MSETDLKKRTKAFALRILKLVDSLPNTVSGRALAAQLVRSGTSVAANYRAARRAKSPRTFSQNSAMSKRRPTKRCFGSSCLKSLEWSRRSDSQH